MTDQDDFHANALLETLSTPIAVSILLLWFVCFGSLVICSCVDTCDEAQLKTRWPSRLPRIYEHAATDSEIADVELSPEQGYEDMESYLHRAHLHCTSD